MIQKLGEAIHETVSESEDIASVVQDIRKQGFDVLLMLEATIGLNEVEQQPKQLTANSTSGGEAEAGVVDSATGFTSQDVNFLRSLRIAVESETGTSAGRVHRQLVFPGQSLGRRPSDPRVGGQVAHSFPLLIPYIMQSSSVC